MKKRYQKDVWVKRGLGLGIRTDIIFKFFQKITFCVFAIFFSFLIFKLGENIYFQEQRKKQYVEAWKNEKARRELEEKKKYKEKLEMEKWINDRIAEDKKYESRNKNISYWNYIKETLYPKGTYIINKSTMEKGRVIDFQGNRVFTDMGWWFDVEDENIEKIGYSEYKKYVKYIQSIKG